MFTQFIFFATATANHTHLTVWLPQDKRNSAWPSTTMRNRIILRASHRESSFPKSLQMDTPPAIPREFRHQTVTPARL